MGMVRARKGATMVLCLVFLIMFSALAACMATVSGTSVQTAKNQRNASAAFMAAESGLEVVRYWVGRFVMPKTTLPADYLSTLATSVQSDLKACNVGNITIQNDGSISAVALNSAEGTSFTAQFKLDPTNPDVVLVEITGTGGGATRTIQAGFTVAPYEHPIFNYGMATKGAIHFPSNPTFTGATTNWEADIYAESGSDLVAIDVGGNANFDGEINIGNPAASVNFAGDVQIAGDTGQAAIDNHVHVGADPVDFPAPETDIFEVYATGPTINGTSDLSKGITLVNAKIAENTNPTFGGTVTIEGILFIESPNIVTFSRNCQLNGIIVGDGCLEAMPGDQLNFQGNFATGPYPAGEEFEGLSSLIGTSIMAPGFAASFTGNFSTIDGVIATSGLTFSGNASALVKGTMINYSDTPTIVDGNISVSFDRVASVKIPAGFDTHRVLAYDPTSYAMVF